MPRRKKTFEERRQELIGSANMISNAIQHCENSGEIYPLRVVAVQLRALLVDKQPLLIELAKQEGFSLTVYTTDPTYTEKVLALQPVFYSTGDPISLEKDHGYPTETDLEEALWALHVVLGSDNLPLRDVIRLVADTEAAHYDPGRPEHLDELDCVNLGGLPVQYRTVYSLGRVVRDLCYKFIRATG